MGQGWDRGSRGTAEAPEATVKPSLLTLLASVDGNRVPPTGCVTLDHEPLGKHSAEQVCAFWKLSQYTHKVPFD